jgi:hypothetical protein
MRAAPAVTFLFASALSASAQTPQPRDGEGVRVVANPSRLKAPVVFALGDKPTFHFGGLQPDPADELDARNGYVTARVLSDTRVVIADKTRVLIFDRAGKRVGSFGRSGQGPGESNQVYDICIARGDTILVGQSRSLPVSRFSSEGKFISAIPIAGQGYSERAFCFADGSIRTMRMSEGAMDAPQKFEFFHVRTDGSTSLIARAEFPVWDPLIVVPYDAVAWGDRLYVMSGASFDILSYAPDGTLRSIIRTDDPLVPISAAERSKLPLTAFRRGATEAEKEASRQRDIARSKTKHWPTMARLLFDATGRMWVQDWRPANERDSTQTWTAFDGDGRLIGKLAIPPKERSAGRLVIAFGRDEVFFRTNDEDGAVHVTAYPILPIKGR